MRLPPRDSVDHSPGRSQRWPDVDADISRWTGEIVERLSLLDRTVGVYLHGSLAMGGFVRPKSDLDLIAVTDTPLSDGARSSLATDLVELFDYRPITGGVEVSVIRREVAEAFRHPAPYEFHFSEQWAAGARRGEAGPSGTDPDLAAHCTVVRSRGLALVGPAPDTVFGEVPRQAYLDAIFDDLHWILDGGILESPFYGVLNICRGAHLLLDDPGEPPSKPEGAAWALEHLPVQHHAVVADALSCYRSAAPVTTALRRHHGHRWDEHALLAIAGWARTALPTVEDGLPPHSC